MAARIMPIGLDCHIPVARGEEPDRFAGICPVHGDCVEGLASGPATAARWGADLSELSGAPEKVERIAGYLAQFAASLVLLHMPERLIVGGGGNEDIRPDRGLAPRYRAPTWRLRPCEPARFRFRTLRHRAGARRRFRNYRCDSSGQAGGEWRMSGGRADLWIEDA